jgi:hypothetical protein
MMGNEESANLSDLPIKQGSNASLYSYDDGNDVIVLDDEENIQTPAKKASIVSQVEYDVEME